MKNMSIRTNDLSTILNCIAVKVGLASNSFFGIHVYENYMIYNKEVMYPLKLIV